MKYPSKYYKLCFRDIRNKVRPKKNVDLFIIVGKDMVRGGYDGDWFDFENDEMIPKENVTAWAYAHSIPNFD